MQFDDKIRDKYDGSLNNESWLEPSVDVLSAIKEEIYTEKTERRFALLLWLLMGLGIISFLSVLITFNIPSKIISTTTSDISLPKSPIPADKEMVNLDTKTTLSNKASENATNKIAVDKTINKTKTTSNTISNSTLKNNTKSILTKKANSIYKDEIGFNNIKQNVLFHAESSVIETAVQNTRATNTILEQNTATTNRPVTNINIGVLNRLDTRLVHGSKIPELNNKLIETMQQIEKTNKRISYFISTGVSLWNFDLNDKFEMAVEPADFTHNKGKGQFFQLGFMGELTNKILWKTSLSYERIAFESGHNSQLEYLLSEEMGEMNNNIDLLMATPLGTLGSNIVVERTDTEIQGNNAFIVDLHNRHTISNFDFNLGTAYKLIANKKSFAALEIGMGANYLSKISNELFDFSTDHQGLISRESKITQDQTEIKTFRLYYNIGASYDHKIRENCGFGISYNARFDFSPIYTNDDQATLLSRQNISLYLRKAF